MKIKVGDYVRTKSNGIQKVDEEGRINLGLIRPPILIIKKEEIIKSSPNIIDLIEVGDIVNGHLVFDIAQAPKKAIYIEDASNKMAHIPYLNEEIRTVITHERIKNMEYKVE